MKNNMENKCFWSHNFTNWTQEEPKEMYVRDLRVKDAIPYLDYTIFVQKRFCKDCNYMEVKKERVNNY